MLDLLIPERLPLFFCLFCISSVSSMTQRSFFDSNLLTSTYLLPFSVRGFRCAPSRSPLLPCPAPLDYFFSREFPRIAFVFLDSSVCPFLDPRGFADTLLRCQADTATLRLFPVLGIFFSFPATRDNPGDCPGMFAALLISRTASKCSLFPPPRGGFFFFTLSGISRNMSCVDRLFKGPPF